MKEDLLKVVAGILAYIILRIACAKRGRIKIFGIGISWRN